MKHIIGLDIGTNSVGWAFVKESKKDKIELIDIGTYIFPIGTIVDAKSNKEKTKNEQRREYRGTRRNIFRYKLRRKKLKSILNSIDLIPDFKKNYKIKGKYQSTELYKLRSEAIEKKIPLEEIGRIFLLLNKHRGFKSNAKKFEKESEDEGIVKTSIKSLKDLMNKADAKTLGQYFYKMHELSNVKYNSGDWHNPDELIDERAYSENGKIVLNNSRGIRRQFGRYTEREMYLNEFDLIWSAQKKYYLDTHHDLFTGSAKEYKEILERYNDELKDINNENSKQIKYKEKLKAIKEFKNSNYWKIRNYCIYYQRPLRSQKKFLSNCQFEKNKKVIPASSPLFQEFRIWKVLSDLRYSDERNNIFSEILPVEWKKILAEKLETIERVRINKPSKKGKDSEKICLLDLLELRDSSIKFNLHIEESEKDIKGNLTYYAFCQSMGAEKFNELKDKNKLNDLWHHIYIAKDDEWLKDTLLYKWQFSKNINFSENEAIVSKLIEFGLENDYGSYSSKVIKKILPFMKKGNDEYTSLLLSGYLKSPDEEKEKVVLKKKISQLKYQELRNPVVEKSISQVIKIVNKLLEKYNDLIDRDNLEIRIESTRELKKPRSEREKILRNNRDKDLKRQEYADFLNLKSKDGTFNFNKRIEKYDRLIYKFELWLEMKMDPNDPLFLEFEKISKKGDNEKQRLWCECNRICPYTSKVISLKMLFSPEIEIEHIIPLSRSLDDSYNNKTITFSSVNKEKGNLTSYEYMNLKNDFENFRKRIKDFPKSKIANFEMKNVSKEFSGNQISNTSYIAKFTRTKLSEVSNSVQFTNGAATSQLRKYDWNLDQLLDQVRYEEKTGIEIDKIIQYYKTERNTFYNWYHETKDKIDEKLNIFNIPDDVLMEYDKKFNENILETVIKLKSYEEFRNKSGKKDRSDHRHHAIDSFITACCSRAIIKKLSDANRVREEFGISQFNHSRNISRDLVDCPFDYIKLKNSIMNIIVVHNISQKLISSNVNNIKSGKKNLKQKTYGPQGSLHKDGIYGKLKNPENQNISKNDAYVKRIPLYSKNGSSMEVSFTDLKSLEKIYDPNLKEIMKKRIEKYGNGKKAFSIENLTIDPLYVYSTKKYPEGSITSINGASLPVIKNIRVLNKNSRNLVQLPAKDEQSKIINLNRYSETDGNYIMIFYELKETIKNKIKITRDYRILSFFEAVNRKRTGVKLFEEMVEKDGKLLPLMENCNWLKQGDLVAIYNNPDEKEKILDGDKFFIKKCLYKITELNNWANLNYEYGLVKLSHVNKVKNTSEKYTTTGDFRKFYHSSLNAIKIRLNELGEIIRIG